MQLPTKMWLVLNAAHQVVKCSPALQTAFATAAPPHYSFWTMLGRKKDKDRLTVNLSEVRSWAVLPMEKPKTLHWFSLNLVGADQSVNAVRVGSRFFKLKHGLHFTLVIVPEG